MTSINSLNNSTYLNELLASQSGGTAQGSNEASDAFAALFKSILDGTTQAQSTASATADTTSTSQTPAASDLKALGQALASGNLSAAQLAYQSLQADLESAQKAHHHHHPGGEAQVNAAADTTSTTGSTAVQAVTPASQADILALLLSRN